MIALKNVTAVYQRHLVENQKLKKANLYGKFVDARAWQGTVIGQIISIIDLRFID